MLLFTGFQEKRLVIAYITASALEAQANNQHKNARTAFHGRALIVRGVMQEGMNASEVAEQLGISSSTVYKWVARYKSGGEAALHNGSSCPNHSSRCLPVGTVPTIVAMRRMRMTSPAIAFTLSLPLSSVGLELRRLGFNRMSRLEPKPPVMRYEHDKPGDMIRLDIKKLGRIDGVGHRITGNRSRRARGAGWEYLHVCVDDHSRLAYGELLADEKGVTATSFLIRAVDWFEQHGVKVRRVMTDNGICYVSRLFQAAVHRAGARHICSRPYTPGINGKAERFIQTSIKECAYSQAHESSVEREEHLNPWLDFYKNQRPHSALKRKPLVSRLQKP